MVDVHCTCRSLLFHFLKSLPVLYFTILRTCKIKLISKISTIELISQIHCLQNYMYMYCYVSGVISWRSEFTTDEDLSGVQAIETTGGALKWTQEPPLNTEDTNWAQFGEFSPGNERYCK